MFGGVPIIVTMPPRMLAKANGMSRMLGERFCSVAVFNVTGSMSASAPTLFMNAESTPATPARLKMCRVWFLASGVICRASRSTTPELLNARLMIRTAATVITAG